jgi:hypothetical protein
MAPMPALTRRRYLERLDCWHVYYGDVHAGTIRSDGHAVPRSIDRPPDGLNSPRLGPVLFGESFGMATALAIRASRFAK